MADVRAPNSFKIHVKFFLAVLIFLALCLMYTYNMGAQELIPSENYNFVYKKMNYILQWPDKNQSPFNFMGEGNSAFIKHKCKNVNCFVTDKKDFLNITEYDAIVFNGRYVIGKQSVILPADRSPKQKYVFGATESSHRFPVCNPKFDNFFNWTWTYKLDSSFRWGYITIYDLEGNRVGPAVDMKWPAKMDPVSEELKAKLSKKSKAAAWFVSHCRTESRREKFVAQVNKELIKYGWKIDTYGSCGNMKCSRQDWRVCNKMVEDEYYFYFSLENSFSEDYVTEKLLTALNNYAVPIVYGSADYSRFLPPGSYLNGIQLGPKKLAYVMHQLINNKEEYYQFFEWRNHFNYTQTVGNIDVCNICDALNDEHMMAPSVWEDFRKWWNGARYLRSCP